MSKRLRQYKALAQPKFKITRTPKGAKKVWPTDPPALSIPKANPDFSDGTLLFTADIATARPAIPEPPALSRPIQIMISKVLEQFGIKAIPKA